MMKLGKSMATRQKRSFPHESFVYIFPLGKLWLSMGCIFAMLLSKTMKVSVSTTQFSRRSIVLSQFQCGRRGFFQLVAKQYILAAQSARRRRDGRQRQPAEQRGTEQQHLRARTKVGGRVSARLRALAVSLHSLGAARFSRRRRQCAVGVGRGSGRAEGAGGVRYRYQWDEFDCSVKIITRFIPQDAYSFRDDSI